MNEKNTILSLISSRSWEKLADLYSPDEIIRQLSFKDGLRLAYGLLYNKNWEERYQEYSITLLYKIRQFYPDEWDSSWKYDALLGLACDIIGYKHDERYEAYKRAFDRCDNPPPRLLIELASCCSCPGSPPISYDEAIDFAMQAVREAPYRDGINVLREIYFLKGDEEKENYWAKMLEEPNEGFTSPSIEPEFLVEEFFGKG